MARLSRHQQPPPEDSWVLEGDVEISDSEENDQSDEVEEHEPEVASSRLQAKSVSRKRQRISHSSPNIAQGGPDLIMPTMYQSETLNQKVTPARRAAARQRKQVQTTDEFEEQIPKVSQPRRGQAPSTPPSTSDGETIPYYAGLLWSDVLFPLLRLGLSAFKIIFNILKPLLALGLAFWILAFCARYLVTNAISRTVMPLCQIPGASYLNLPF